jgi:hypothetical protein
MKRCLVSLWTLVAMSLLPFNIIAQTKFESGYFVDKQGNRIECLIRNDDWLRSPKTIRYKSNAASEQLSIDIRELKEFGVPGTQFVCTKVRMDTSSQDTKTLTTVRAPMWDSRYVAMKVLVDGKAKLYHYDDKKILLFFYSVDNSPIEQLEYKSYLHYMETEKYFKVGQNLNYINQLKEKVSCGEVFTKYAINKFKYRSDFLTDYFDRYNKCSGGDQPTAREVRQKKTRFHLKLTPGINFGSAKVQRTYSTSGKYSDVTPAFRIGADAEIVLPFNNNKWRILLEPTYQSISIDSPVPVDYSSIELPVGLRHYFYLNDNFTIFLDASVVFDALLNLKAQINTRDNLSISDTKEPSYAFGLGAGYKRFSLEGRVYSVRYRFDDLLTYECAYKQITVIAGFRLF